MGRKKNMNELVRIKNDQVVVSSRQIAEHFGKQHKHVLEAIRVEKGYAEKSADPQMFFETTYIQPQNKQEYVEYLMNRDGFTLLVMGFTGKRASEWKRKYIHAFNEMEKRLRKLELTPSYQIDDRIKRAEAWIKEEKERIKLAENNKKLLAKKKNLEERLTKESKFRRTVFDTTDCITYTDAAKVIIPLFKGFGRQKMIEFLREIRAIDKNNIPYARYIKSGHFKVKECLVIPFIGHKGFVKKQGYITQKGLDWIIKRYGDMKGVDLK